MDDEPCRSTTRRRRQALLREPAPATPAPRAPPSGGGPAAVPGADRPPPSAAGRGPTLVRDPQPPLVARADGRAEQRPGQLHEALVGERAKAPQQGGPTLGAREVAHGACPARPARRAGRPRAAAARAPRDPSAPRRPASPPPSARGARASRAAASRGSRRRAGPGTASASSAANASERAGSSGPSERTRAAIGRTLAALGSRALAHHDADRLATATPERHEHRLAGLEVPEARRARGRCTCAARVRPARRRPPRPGGRRPARAKRPPRSRPSVGGTALPSADADPPVRVAALLLLDDRLDLRGRPLDLAGLVDHDAVVVALARELDGGVALPDLQLVGGLGGARAEALEQGLERRRARGTRAAPRARAA